MPGTPSRRDPATVDAKRAADGIRSVRRPSSNDCPSSFEGTRCGGCVGLRTVALRRPQNGLIALLATLLAAFLVLGIPAGAAQADTTDDGQEITQFYFAGNITFEGTPIDGVTVSVEGNGFDAKTETDADGKWRLYVPEKEKYTLAVDEDSLPEGVIVDATKLPE